MINRHLLKKSKAIICLYQLLANLCCILANRFGKQIAIGGADSGSTHKTFSPEKSLQYIHLVTDEYIKYGGIGSLENKDILEVGPGDNLGVALLMCAQGAGRVVALDRFYSPRNKEQETSIYRALINEMPPLQQSRAELCLSDKNSGPRIDYVHGIGIDDPAIVEAYGQFDLIVSRAVLEEVKDINQAILNMAQMLKPSGKMVHKIDFRDYGMFSDYHHATQAHHPLTFLTINDNLWQMMTSHRSFLNRAFVNSYIEQFSRLGFKVAVEQPVLYETEPAGTTGEWLLPIRKKLLPRFRQLPDEILQIKGAFIVVQK